jgi:ferritin-like metal-binding protein YciE
MANNNTYDNLQELFILKLNSLYYVEKELVKALPKMARAATSPELRQGFTDHLHETEMHVSRIEQALDSIGERPKQMSVSAIDGLIADADWIIKNVKNDEARDAALIAAAQYVENYEKAGYGTAITWAQQMEHGDTADILMQTLEEEKAADEKLSQLAESEINERANVGSIM